MKEAFSTQRFSAKSQELIDTANRILDRYAAMGYDLSLRQLYYQFVSVNVIDNSERSYKCLGDLISNARLAGLIDWDMIKDRTRETQAVPHWESPAEIVEAAARSFRLDKWQEQPCYVEVMLEKQALEGVLLPVCAELDLMFTANRGYSSSSAFYEAGQRLRLALRDDKELCVLYLGDHDPSGIDMGRDLEDRLSMFAGAPVQIQRLALNMDQIEAYGPPENPAKTTDSRFAAYIARFGASSWELDALAPNNLADLVRTAAAALRDEDLWEAAVAREEIMRAELAEYATDYQGRG